MFVNPNELSIIKNALNLNSFILDYTFTRKYKFFIKLIKQSFTLKVTIDVLNKNICNYPLCNKKCVGKYFCQKSSHFLYSLINRLPTSCDEEATLSLNNFEFSSGVKSCTVKSIQDEINIEDEIRTCARLLDECNLFYIFKPEYVHCFLYNLKLNYPVCNIPLEGELLNNTCNYPHVYVGKNGNGICKRKSMGKFFCNNVYHKMFALENKLPIYHDKCVVDLDNVEKLEYMRSCRKKRLDFYNIADDIPDTATTTTTTTRIKSKRMPVDYVEEELEDDISSIQIDKCCVEYEDCNNMGIHSDIMNNDMKYCDDHVLNTDYTNKLYKDEITAIRNVDLEIAESKDDKSLYIKRYKLSSDIGIGIPTWQSSFLHSNCSV